jgi:hypothetical protein
LASVFLTGAKDAYIYASARQRRAVPANGSTQQLPRSRRLGKYAKAHPPLIDAELLVEDPDGTVSVPHALLKPEDGLNAERQHAIE